MNRRLPKFGFHNLFRVEYQTVNVGRLQELINDNKIEGNVNFETLYKLGVINNKRKPLKILGNGEISSSISIEAHHFTKSAKEKIESAGGTVTVNE